MIRFALRNLFSRPLRSLLALMGLTVAIAGMVGLFSVAAGLNRLVDDAFGRAPGLVAMQFGAMIPIFSRIPAGWADEIAALPGVHQARRELWSRVQTLDGQVVFNPPRALSGMDVTASLKLRKSVYRDDLREGRFLAEDDAGTFACLISRQIAKETKKRVGDRLQVDGHDAHVVGIYDTGSILLDMVVLMHEQDARAVTRFDPNVISSVYIETNPGVSHEELMTRIRDLFRGRGAEQGDLAAMLGNGDNPLTSLAKNFVRTVQPAQAAGDAKSADQAEGIEVRTARDWGQRLVEFNADLDIFLTLMTMIGLVIAFLSILNTMLMSVSERMIEFGVLKANGWTRGNILQLITLESAALGVCGGALGCLFGWTGVQIVNRLYETKVSLYASPGILVFSFLFSIILGIAGGLYPAWWAVKMSPMEAIRRV